MKDGSRQPNRSKELFRCFRLDDFGVYPDIFDSNLCIGWWIGSDIKKFKTKVAEKYSNHKEIA